MSIPTAWPHVLDFFGTPLVIEPLPGQLTSHAGLPPVRPFDQRSGLTNAFADPLDDPRDPGRIAHSFREMVRSRVHGILAGYADQNDHDTKYGAAVPIRRVSPFRKASGAALR
jgi:hypothetical protein